MKPVKLVIEGVNSFSERTEIDFRPLLKNGIFGIFGDTGSGKSSILDSIVLALYGTVDRAVTKDNFVNVRCDRATVDFVFETTEEGAPATFEVERAFVFGKDRKTLRTEAKMSRIVGGAKMPFADKATDVNRAVEEVVGLCREDFQRCIALPQGEFAAFVKAARAERLDIVGRLFSLEKYSAVWAEAKREEEALSLECRTLEGRLQEKENYTAEGEKLLLEELERTERAKKEADARAREAETKLGDAERRAQKAKLLAEAEGQLVVLQSESRTAGERAAAADRSERAERAMDAAARLTAAASERADARRRADALTARAERAERALRDAERAAEDDGGLRLLTERRAAIAASEISAKTLADKETEVARLRAAYAEAERAERALAEEERKISEEKRALETAAESGGELSALYAGAARAEIAGRVAGARRRLAPLYDGSAYAAASEEEWQALQTALEGEGTADVPDLRAALARREAAEKAAARLAELRKKEGEVAGRRAAEGAKKEDLRLRGSACREESDRLSAALREVLGGKRYAEALADAERKIREYNAERERRTAAANAARQEKAEADKAFSAACAAREIAEKAVREAEKALAAALEDSGFSSLVEASAGYLDRGAREAARKAVAAVRERLAAKKSEAEGLRAECAGAPDGETLLEMRRESEALKQESEQKTKTLGSLQESLKNYGQNLAEKCIIEKSHRELSRRRDLAAKLRDLVAGRKLMEYVAEEYLADVADAASRTLLELSGGRYFLVYDRDFRVGDNYNGGERRPVATLSGGETFLVSLSLAVALSTAIYQKSLRPVEFFFLDEGFGTLDEGLVEVVLDSLEKLKDSHFAIGLISHVAELKHRIANKILVRGATAERGSRIEIVG